MAKKRKKKAAADSTPTSAFKADDASSLVPTTKSSGKRTWKFMDRGAAVVGSLLASRATAVAWRALSGKKVPSSGRHPELSTREAVLYAIIAGALAELLKTVVRRGTATYWVRSTGQLPPGMKPLAQTEDSAAAAVVDQVSGTKAPPRRRNRRRR